MPETTTTPPKKPLKELRRERAIAEMAAADAAAKAALERAKAKKAAAKKVLDALAKDERATAAKAKRKAEDKAKIIVGALAKQAGLVADLAAKASERDREHLRSVGWL